jgi:lysophospholipase L1-like esterase
MRLLSSAAVIIAIVVLLGACSGASARHYDGVYLSLGDSVAAGDGASDRASTSFAALLAKDEGGLAVENLAVAGATTRDVIQKQLPEIDAALSGRKIAFITISIGGNDLGALIPNTTCQQEPLPASCPLDDALASVTKNLDDIMRQLREKHGGAPIVLLLYPNFFSGTGHAFEAPAARVLPRLDEAIGGVAARYKHTSIARTAAVFEGEGSRLTHVLDPRFDPHPNDAGHRLIADAFVAALKDVR